MASTTQEGVGPTTESCWNKPRQEYQLHCNCLKRHKAWSTEINKAYRAKYTTKLLIFASPRHFKFSFETIVFAYVYVAKAFFSCYDRTVSHIYYYPGVNPNPKEKETVLLSSSVGSYSIPNWRKYRFSPIVSLGFVWFKT